MFSKQTIEKFCADIGNYTNQKTLKPFNYNGYTYATDGKVGIRIPLREEYKFNAPIEMDRVWPRINLSEMKFNKLPNLLESIFDFDTFYNSVKIKINEVWFQFEYLKKFSVFNNIMIHIPKNCDYKSIPASLIFDGGEGVLMPIRKPKK